jgi:hypothetical protein
MRLLLPGVLVLALALPLHADNNLLRNGDFSLGLADWVGDCHTPEANSDDLTQTAVPTGVVVKLRHFDWTKMTQDFDGKAGDYQVTVTYSVSPDLKFSTKAEDYQNIPGKVGFNRLSAFGSNPGTWILIVNDLGNLRFNYWKITPGTGAGR